MSANLMRTIELGLKLSGVAPSRFGRMVAHDPRLVFDIRRGRQIRGELEARVRGCLARLCEERPQ